MASSGYWRGLRGVETSVIAVILNGWAAVGWQRSASGSKKFFVIMIAI
jgi:hypothetical protein